MTTPEQFANQLGEYSRERMIQLFYDSIKKAKEYKDRFEQAEQEKKQLIIEKDKAMPEKAKGYLKEQILAEKDEELRKVKEQAEKEKQNILNEKDKELYKVKTEFEKFKKDQIPAQGFFAMQPQSNDSDALAKARAEVKSLQSENGELEKFIEGCRNTITLTKQ